LPEPSIKEITTALKEFKDNKTLQPSLSAPIDSTIKKETLLHPNEAHHHGGSGGGAPRMRYVNFNCGNTKSQDGVCFCCRCSGHLTHKTKDLNV